MSTQQENYLQQRIDKDSSYKNLLQFPKYFEIETVNACNARCPMCTIGDWKRKTPTMETGLFKKIADEIAENRETVKRVSLYRDGEPLLDKKLPDRITYLKEKQIKRVGIATNVSLLGKTRARNILEAGIDEVILSVDSLQKPVFEEMRAGLNFETVRENAEEFIKLRNQINPTTSIWMRMVAGDKNLNEWPEYEKYWGPKLSDNDRLYYHSMHNWGGQVKLNKSAFSYEPSRPCVALWSLMVIFGNGDVPLCNIDYNNKFPTGSVINKSIESIWQSKVNQERRDQHMNGQKSKISLCTNCNVWDEQLEHEIEGDYFGENKEIPITV